MKAYRMKHIPTGMYYQPHRFRGSNLSQKGKIYQTAINGISAESHKKNRVVVIYVKEGSIVHRKTKHILNYQPYEYEQVYAVTRYEDWIKEEIQ